MDEDRRAGMTISSTSVGHSQATCTFAVNKCVSDIALALYCTDTQEGRGQPQLKSERRRSGGSYK